MNSTQRPPVQLLSTRPGLHADPQSNQQKHAQHDPCKFFIQFIDCYHIYGQFLKTPPSLKAHTSWLVTLRSYKLVFVLMTNKIGIEIDLNHQLGIRHKASQSICT